MKDKLWRKIKSEALEILSKEPLLSPIINGIILSHECLENSITHQLSQKISSNNIAPKVIKNISQEAFRADGTLIEHAELDLLAVFDRDPACTNIIQPILFFKGYLALQAYRISNWLWNENRTTLAYFFQSRLSEVFGIDIHPGAKIGNGIMIDHGHSIVIGETSIIGNNVSILHSVTLGGTGKEDQKRHPTIEDGVLLGAGAKVLGDITVGFCSKIASGSVVLQSVPPQKTAAGVPAKIVGDTGCSEPSITMDQLIRSI